MAGVFFVLSFFNNSLNHIVSVNVLPLFECAYVTYVTVVVVLFELDGIFT